jgi:hypothetical protein
MTQGAGKPALFFFMSLDALGEFRRITSKLEKLKIF